MSMSNYLINIYFALRLHEQCHLNHYLIEYFQEFKPTNSDSKSTPPIYNLVISNSTQHGPYESQLKCRSMGCFPNIFSSYMQKATQWWHFYCKTSYIPETQWYVENFRILPATISLMPHRLFQSPQGCKEKHFPPHFSPHFQSTLLYMCDFPMRVW